MSNMIIGWPRHNSKMTIDAGYGSYDSDFPAANASVFPFSRVARTDDNAASSMKIRGTFSEPVKAELITLCHHNVEDNATTFRFKGYEDDAYTTQVIDVEDVVWPEVYTEDQVDWDGGRWFDRTYTDEEKSNYPWYRPYYIEGGNYIQSFEFELVSPAQTNYWQYGLLDIAAATILPRNYSYGLQLGYRSRSEVAEAEGGVEYYKRRQKPRVIVGSIDLLEVDNALAFFFEQLRQNDIDQPFMVWMDKDDPLHILRNCFMARNDDLGLLTHVANNFMAVPLNFKEIL